MNHLFSPFDYKSLHLKNRIVMAPMTRNKSPGNIPGEDVAKYYRRRAEAGVGLIITEGTVIGHKAGHGYPDVPSFHGAEALKGWKHVVDEVHAAGGKIFPQLWHVGSVRQSHKHMNQGADNPEGTCCEEGRIPGYAPSPVPHPSVEDGEVPHEMSIKDIKNVVQAFGKAAKEAKALGFDGVEIHGAHGYLIDQFFWDVTNKRMDQYGGRNAAERTRFAVEVIQAVRKAVGKDFPICFRYSQWKLGSYDSKLVYSPEELGEFLKPLVAAGVDIFHCSSRRYWEPEFTGSDMNLAGWTKKLTGHPAITVGSVGLDVDFVTTMKDHKLPKSTLSHQEYIESCLEKGEFDLVAVGRALLADPLWAEKMREERYDEIKPFAADSLKKLF